MSISQTMIPTMHSFHFIRPYFLWMMLPVLLMTFLLWKYEQMSNAWQRYIDPALLKPLLKGKINRSQKILPLLCLLFWTLCTLALAGPAWEKLPTPVEKRDAALVILMDLSPSMLAGDIKPSRLVAARHKIMDLLQLRKEGYTALIGYSGDAHVVSPLTDDTQTIANLLNVLEPGIMPVYGSNLEDALTLALQLFQNAGYTQGDILLVTDGITDEALGNTTHLLQGKPFTLSIIGVGTETGGPIPTNHGDFVKSKEGKIILPQLHAKQLITLARKVNGYYSPLQLDDEDIKPLIKGTAFFSQKLANQDKTKKSPREFDQWRDIGGTLCLFLLPLLLMGFRRGLLFSFILPLILMPIPQARADENPAPATTSNFHMPSWKDLWLNDNQRAMKAMRNNSFNEAARQFKDPNWKASAQYQQGDYSSALEQFRQDNSAKGLYNQGNALAKSGQLQEAINAYKEALKRNPQFEDAAFNKKIVEDLLKQQKQQSQDQKSQGQSDNQSKSQPSDQGQQNNQNGDQQQNQSGNQKNADSKSNEENSNNSQKARSEDNKNNQAAQKESGENGEDQSENKKPGQQDMDNDQDKTGDQEKITAAENKLTPEQKQALEQWLRQVPDDPSGLLRNKFEYYYQQRLQVQQSGKAPKHMNDEERW